MTDLQATLDAIDAVTADACAWCQTRLTDTAHSRDFCSQGHQARWQAAQVGIEPDPTLLDESVTHEELQFALIIPLPPLEVTASLSAALLEFGRHINAFTASMRSALEAFQNAGLIEEQPPTDPRARALWLRRNRNTGPARPPQRAPRHLGATARRRTR